MSRQDAVRNALRSAWPELLSEVLPGAIAASQENAAAGEVLQILWPALRPDDVANLDRGDADFLVRGRTLPTCFDTVLTEALLRCAEVYLQSMHAGNPYAQGASLRQLIRREVRIRRSEIYAGADRVFEAEQTDRLASPRTIRERVLHQLFDLALDELPQLCAADEMEARRRLKILTALATLQGNTGYRVDCIRKIQDGGTAAFPYVVKFLNRGSEPSVRFFAADLNITLAGFSPHLQTAFPEAAHVRTCLDRYIRREGVITRFINLDGPVAPGLEGRYAETPGFLARPQSSLLVPKAAALTQHRRDWSRVPDGIVCAVSLSVLLESLLRQVACELTPGSGPNARGGDLLQRVASAMRLQVRTIELLETVFDQRSLNLRDAMAHGAFFARDWARLEATLAGLSQALRCLVEDLAASGNDVRVFAAPRWDAARILVADVSATVHEQYEPDRNLVRQLLPRRWARDWAVIARLTPDKLAMAQAAFLLWVSGQEDAKLGRDDDTHLFASIHASLITLEELFRAVYEVHGQRVLRIQRENIDRIRCELSILDERPGQLLDPSALRVVFGAWYKEVEFRRILNAVRAVRDHVLHGMWRALQDPLHLYSHLLAMMIHRLCEVVNIALPSDTTPAS